MILCHLPSHTSHEIQLYHVRIFAPVRAAYREKVDRIYWGGLETVRKEDCTSLYKLAREKMITKRNIIVGWATSGLFPLDPDPVLRHTARPYTETAVVTEDGSCQ